MLVAYDNSESESEEEVDQSAARAAPDVEAVEEPQDAEQAVHISDDEDAADELSAEPDADEALNHKYEAAAEDTVEEGLLNRVPASAPVPPAPPSKPSASSASANAAAAAKAEELQKKRQLMQQKRRRLLMLDVGNAEDGEDEDDDDEDAVKRRRIASAAATGQLRGASSLLSRLPKPKALAVREGASRLFVPAAALKQPSKPAPMLPSAAVDAEEFSAAPSAAAAASSSASYPVPPSDFDVEQRLLAGAVLPPKELLRYRQATGASLTAESDAGGGIIDIRQADQVAGSDLELTKQLTRDAGADPRRRPDGPEPSSLAKRKHQITFLAYQAKERELELKNSWSDARFSQRSSQRKYGF